MLLARILMHTATAAKDSDSSLMVGLSCHWNGKEIGPERGTEAIRQHLVAGATEGADFLAVEGVDAPADGEWGEIVKCQDLAARLCCTV